MHTKHALIISLWIYLSSLDQANKEKTVSQSHSCTPFSASLFLFSLSARIPLWIQSMPDCDLSPPPLFFSSFSHSQSKFRSSYRNWNSLSILQSLALFRPLVPQVLRQSLLIHDVGVALLFLLLLILFPRTLIRVVETKVSAVLDCGQVQVALPPFLNLPGFWRGWLGDSSMSDLSSSAMVSICFWLLFCLPSLLHELVRLVLISTMDSSRPCLPSSRNFLWNSYLLLAF